jgi:hypothetical protein
MIPYDDLVVALASWRARQGLPVSSSLVAATSAAPVAHGGFLPDVATPPPLQPAPEPELHEEAIAVDDAALLEEAHYENEGSDFALAFDRLQQHDGESTTIGGPPSRDSFGSTTDPDPDVPGGKRGDW